MRRPGADRRRRRGAADRARAAVPADRRSPASTRACCRATAPRAWSRTRSTPSSRPGAASRSTSIAPPDDAGRGARLRAAAARDAAASTRVAEPERADGIWRIDVVTGAALAVRRGQAASSTTSARRARAVPDPGRRRHGGVHGPAVVAGRLAAARARAAVLDDAADPVRDDRLGGAAGQGAADEPAHAERRVRPARADLPGRPARRAARLHGAGRARVDAADPAVLRSRSACRPTTGSSCSTRIKEARDAGAADREAVAIGLERTGRIVTFAALLFCIAIGAFATSRGRVHQGARRRHRARGADRRVHRARAARPVADGAARPLELVGAASAGPAARAAYGSARRDPARRLPRHRLEHRRSPREPAGGGRGPVDARRRRARLLVGLRDRAGRRGARPARVLQRLPADRDAARSGRAARRVQGGRARARAASPAASATGRGRSTSTCCCSATCSTSPSGCGCRTARCSRGGSCSCRCSSSTRTSRCRAAGARPTRWRALGPGQDVRLAGPPLDVGS